MPNVHYDHELSESEAKGAIREFKEQDIQVVSVGARRANMLSLPGINFDLEIRAARLGFKVYCVEFDAVTFAMQEDIVAELPPIVRGNIVLYHGSLEDFLVYHADLQFEFANVDLCATFSKPLLRTLLMLAHSTHVMWVNIMMSREKTIVKYFNECNGSVKEKVKVCKSLLLKMKWLVTQTYQYNNEKSSRNTPMCEFRCVNGKFNLSK